MLHQIRFLLLGCALTALMLAGCAEEPLPRGVVALVNGQPIYLRTLETMQDTRTTGLGAFEKPSLNTLRQQYGAALTSLIVHVLVMQEMERLGLPVSEAAVSEAEALIRQDYADEEFEKNLTENAIDLDAWRELMRYRVGMALFVEQVLRPGVTVSLAEAEAGYAAHKDALIVPRMLNVYQIVSTNKALLEKARKDDDMPEESPEVSVYHFNIRYDALPPQWQKAVRALKRGEATPVMAVDGRFEVVWLSDDVSEHRLDMVEAYPHIEQMLLEDKLDAAFQTWLEQRLQTAKIRVSVHLADQLRGSTP